jgi:hypothetical protein
LRRGADTAKFEGEKSVGAAALQIAALQAQLAGKEELLARTQSLVDAATEQKARRSCYAWGFCCWWC